MKVPLVSVHAPSVVKGPLIYAVVVVTSTTAISLAMRTFQVSVGEPGGLVFVLAAMWMPAAARLVATSTVDRGWKSPLPAGRWGQPAFIVMAFPLATVTAIYLGAYALSALAHVPRTAPLWTGSRLIANVIINLVLLSAVGAAGALGEELGWRGYLQPRLDQLEVRYSLFWVITIETLFHLPLILLAGYLGAANFGASIALFFVMGLGLTPLWTWAAYRWRSLWIAVWFHTFHNAVSQTVLPKALGAGDPLFLGESGLFPVFGYLVAGLSVFVVLRRRGQTWASFASSRVSNEGLS